MSSPSSELPVIFDRKGDTGTPFSRHGKFARPAELETRPGVLHERDLADGPSQLRADELPGAETALCSVSSQLTGGSSHRGAASFGAALILGVCLAWGAMWLLGVAERHVTGNDTGEITVLRGAR